MWESQHRRDEIFQKHTQRMIEIQYTERMFRERHWQIPEAHPLRSGSAKDEKVSYQRKEAKGRKML